MENFKIFFTQFLMEKYPNESNYIIKRINQHYNTISIDTAFVKTSKNPLDKRLDFSAYFLAFFKTLEEKNESFDSIRKYSHQIAYEYVKPKNKLQGKLKILLPKMINTSIGKIFIKYLQKRASINTNTDGFKAKIITDKQETFGLGFGFDILECGICKLFRKHNYSKYASILCEIDEITSGLAGLQLIRKGTIANGAKKCDFRFKLEKK